MKVAITGGTGFIGKLLIQKHLDAGDTVRMLTRKPDTLYVHQNLQIHVGNLSDSNSLHAFGDGIDVLYHCAAELRDESKMQDVNVNGTENLIKAVAGKINHWVQLSSVGVYGPVFSGMVYENQECKPENEYEKTKLVSDQLVFEAGRQNLFTYTMIRPSNVFGASMSNKSIFDLVKSIDKGYYFFIGAKGASANYVPVENVVEALYLAATHPNAKNEIFNISDWRTIESFTGSIALALGKREPRLRMPDGLMEVLAKATAFVPGNPLTVSRVKALSSKSKYPTDKIEQKLGYKSAVSVEKVINELVAHYIQNIK